MDDKIILRARRNHLLAQYRAQVAAARSSLLPHCALCSAAHVCVFRLLPLCCRAEQSAAALLVPASPHGLMHTPLQATDAAAVFADATAALAAAVDKQRGKVAEAEALLAEAAAEAGSAGEKRREEFSTNLAQEQLLLSKQEASAAALAAAGAGAGVPALLEVASDALAEALDKKLGATVTDQAIFRAHAAK